MFSTQQTRQMAEELATMVKEGKLTVPIDSVFDMKDALLVSLQNLAFKHLETDKDG